MVLKNTFLVWLTKTKQAATVLNLWVEHYCLMSSWKHILITHFNGNHHQKKNPQYWGIKAVFRTVGFCQWRFFCWSSKTKAVSSEISKQLSRKHSDQIVILTFLKLHILLIAVMRIHLLFYDLGISLPLLRLVPGCSFVIMMIFITCIDLFQ